MTLSKKEQKAELLNMSTLFNELDFSVQIVQMAEGIDTLLVNMDGDVSTKERFVSINFLMPFGDFEEDIVSSKNLLFMCNMDITVPSEKEAEMLKLINIINAQVVLGYFLIVNGELAFRFTNTYPLSEPINNDLLLDTMATIDFTTEYYEQYFRQIIDEPIAAYDIVMQ